MTSRASCPAIEPRDRAEPSEACAEEPSERGARGGVDPPAQRIETGAARTRAGDGSRCLGHRSRFDPSRLNRIDSDRVPPPARGSALGAGWRAAAATGSRARRRSRIGGMTSVWVPPVATLRPPPSSAPSAMNLSQHQLTRLKLGLCRVPKITGLLWNSTIISLASQR